MLSQVRHAEVARPSLRGQVNLMDEEYIDQTSQVVQNKPIRPVLISSGHTVCDNSFLLGHLLVGLADESVPVALVCPPQSDIDSIVSPAVAVVRYPLFRLPLLGYLSKKLLFEQVDKLEPTVLHCVCESQRAVVMQLAEKLQLPYIVTVNSLFGKKQWFDGVPVSLKYSAKIITPAGSIRNNLCERFPSLAEKVVQIDVGTFTAEIAGCFSMSSQIPSLVIPHPADRIEDFVKLVAALKHLAIEGYDFTMVMMSGGRAEGQLRMLLAREELLHRVVSISKLSHWRLALAAGDIFIQPRPQNCFNPLLLEAMSAGVAVAGCKGGVDDLVIDGITSVVFDPDDELDIYDRVKYLLDSPDAARQLAREAQKYLRENHSVSRMISSVLKVYRTL